MVEAKIGKFMPNAPMRNTIANTTRRSGRLPTYRMPTMSPPARRFFGRGMSSRVRIMSSATIIARNVAAFATKTQPEPRATIERPPTAGPIRRAMLKDAEFSATAFDAFSIATMSDTNACRAGASNAFAMPKHAANTSIRGSVITCVSSSAATPRARSISVVWVTSRIRRRSKRSATRPVRPTRTRGGPNCRAIVAPIALASLCVSSVSTTQSCAVDCIQPPMFEMIAPKNQTR